MHQKNIIMTGLALDQAKKAIVMLHGRGASASDILSLSNHLELDNFALIAPQATNSTWYPYSFLVPTVQNEPWLSSALSLLKEITEDLIEKGFNSNQIYFLGFSQGACLALEFTTRNARKWGGVVAFTGGIIGEKIEEKNYSGNFEGTNIFIGTGDPDPHVPIERIKETTALLNKMNANVFEKIYPGIGHTVIEDEINKVNKYILKN